jgi:Ca2+-binding RTX toxin-like protein
MATITYDWVNVVASFTIDQFDTEGDQGAPAVAGLAKGGYFGAWSHPFGETIEGRLLRADGTPATDEFVVHSTTDNLQMEASIAGLIDGRSVVSFTDYSEDAFGDIRARVFRKNGAPMDLDFGVAVGGIGDILSDVGALQSGGYAIAWTRLFENDSDIRVTVFRANGSVRASTVPVENGPAFSSRPSVAGLTDGSFVVAFQQNIEGSGTNEVYFKRFAANGGPLDALPVLIDERGTINQDAQAVALNDGGFAVAWQSNGWIGEGGENTDITVKFFNADGGGRSDYLLANTVVAGAQAMPTITVLSNGFVVVGWNGLGGLIYQAYDAQGNAVGDNVGPIEGVVSSEIAGLSGGLLANVRTAPAGHDDGGTSIRSSVDELLRTITGDGTNETLQGDNLRDLILGEGGKDKLFGFNGKDTLNGGDGNDVLRGGNDRDVLTGAAGADKFAYTDVLQSRPLGALRDTIRDFQNGSDLIDVEAIDADTATGGDQAFVYIGGLAFSAAGQIRGFQSGDDVVLQFSTDADGDAEMELLLKDLSLAVVDGADFVV